MTEPRLADSISVRVRRTTIEEGYVTVRVAGAVMRYETDGTHRLDTAKVFAKALEMGADLGTWVVEQTDIEVHPIQKMPG